MLTVKLSAHEGIEEFWDRKEDLDGEIPKILRSQSQYHSGSSAITIHKSSNLKKPAGKK
jgi:hypothetical protein